MLSGSSARMPPEESERGFYWRLSVWDNLYFHALIYGVEKPGDGALGVWAVFKRSL